MLLAGAPLDPEDPRALLLARASSLIVFSVPLLVAIAAWGRALFGAAGGLMALAVAAFSPTLLAHAPLATPDVPLAATGLIALWLLHRGSHPAAWGAALGLALLTKVTALLFLPIVIVLAVAGSGSLRSAARALAPGLAAAWAVLHLGYMFEGTFDWQGKAALVERIPNGLARAGGWMAAALVPRPYLNAVGRQAHVALSGWRNYLLGETSTDGWPHYYLVALAVKETIPFLVLLAVAAAALRLTRRPLRDEIALALPFALFLAAFSLGRVQIGIRYLLPAFPFLFLFVSRLAAVPGRLRRPARVAAAVLVAAHAASTVRAGPDHIAYFNEIAGGPENGYRYLADSNLDWGQNRTRARQWAADHGAAFDPPVPPQQGMVVVSANRLLGLTDPADRYRGLREGRAPVARVGANWLVFEVGPPR